MNPEVPCPSRILLASDQHKEVRPMNKKQNHISARQAAEKGSDPGRAEPPHPVRRHQSGGRGAEESPHHPPGSG